MDSDRMADVGGLVRRGADAVGGRRAMWGPRPYVAFAPGAMAWDDQPLNSGAAAASREGRSAAGARRPSRRTTTASARPACSGRPPARGCGCFPPTGAGEHRATASSAAWGRTYGARRCAGSSARRSGLEPAVGGAAPPLRGDRRRWDERAGAGRPGRRRSGHRVRPPLAPLPAAIARERDRRDRRPATRPTCPPAQRSCTPRRWRPRIPSAGRPSWGAAHCSGS